MGMTEDLSRWSHEQKCRKTVASLDKNGFTALYCANPQAAAEYIVAGAADSVTVGFAGSMSIVSLGIDRKPRFTELHVLVVNAELGF